MATKTKKNKKGGAKEMTDGELAKELAAVRESMREIHFKAEGSRSKNVKELASAKKRIARILTEMHTRNK